MNKNTSLFLTFTLWRSSNFLITILEAVIIKKENKSDISIGVKQQVAYNKKACQ